VMRFSVVIPLFNKAAEISRSVNSVLAQTFTDFELIVVDDGSTDCGAETVATYADNRIRLIRKENGGVCSARNRGIREAKADLVAFLDADDAWDENFLTEIDKMIEDFPGCRMWGTNFSELYEGKPVHYLPTGLPDGFRGVVEDYFSIPGRVSDLYCSSSVAIRKDVFEKVGLFDERLKYSEDIDMWWRIIARYPVAFYDKVLSYYYYDAGNRAMNRNIVLDQWLPCYPDKYSDYKDCKDFYRYSQRWCAVKLKKLFFSEPSYISLVRSASSRLDYSVLPVKYKFFFKAPYPIAKILYKIKP